MFIPKEKTMSYETVLNLDAFDKRKFNTIFQASKKLQELENDVKSKVENDHFDSHTLLTDVWGGLFKMKPQIKEETLLELTLNKKMMEFMLDNESFQKYREYTRLDDIASVLGTHSFSSKAIEWLKEQQEKNRELQQAIQNMMQFLNQHQSSGGSKSNGQQQEQSQNQNLQNDNPGNQMKDELEKALEEALNQNKTNFNSMMHAAQKEAKENSENVKAVLGNGSDNSSSKMKKVPLEERIKLAELLTKNKKLKEIAEWAGKFKLIAQKKQKTKHNEATSRNGVTIGTNIEELLPIELAMYSHPSTKLDFLRRYSEGQTMQYENRGKDALGRGAIVCCLDQSGSMRGKDVKAKGFLLALLMIAKKQKRDFAYIPFADSVGNVRVFEKGKITVEDIIKIAEEFLGGGTNFVLPLGKAKDVLCKGRFKKGDIIFITDGLANISASFKENFLKSKAEKEFSMCSLVIAKNNEGDRAKETLGEISDEIKQVSNFEDDEALSTFSLL